MLRLRTLLTAVVVLCLATPAAADRAQLKRGLRLYELQKYEEAIAALESAYEADGDPNALYAIGQAYRQLGDCKKALVSYSAYLRTNPPEKKAEAVRAQQERCEAEMARASPSPSPSPSPVAAPSPTPIVAPPPPPPPPRAWYKDRLGAVAGVVGLVGAGLGTALLLLGNDHVARTNGAQSLDAYAGLFIGANTALDMQTAGVITIAAGSALVAAAIVRYVLVRRAAGRERAASASGGAAVTGVGFSF